MAGKATPKVKNGVDKKESEISMTYIDDILLRIERTENDIDSVVEALDSLGLRTKKVESRLGLG
jgi:sporulation-control protein spo0M